MVHNPARYATLPLGVVIRRTPGATRWAKWAWKALPFCPGPEMPIGARCAVRGTPSNFTLRPFRLNCTALRRTPTFTVSRRAPRQFTWFLRKTTRSMATAWMQLLVTASPYEAQDYADSGEEIVEKVPMTEGLIAFVQQFVDTHHVEEEFKKRRRDRAYGSGRAQHRRSAHLPVERCLLRAASAQREDELSRGSDFWSRRKAKVLEEQQEEARAVEAREALSAMPRLTRNPTKRCWKNWTFPIPTRSSSRR